MNIIILGPPGSGKGTQSQFLQQKYKLTHLSTGDLLRDEIKRETVIGKAAKSYINKGQYVPDKIMNEIISNILYKLKSNFILDGYPRTTAQVQWLDQFLAILKQKINIVLYLDINEETIITRLKTRIICPKCQTIYNVNSLPPKVAGICDKDGVRLIKRTDDSSENTIINRLKTYKVATAPLRDSYQHRGLLRILDANQNDKIIKEQINIMFCKRN